MRRITVGLVALALAVSGCGGSNESSEIDRERAYVEVIQEEISGTSAVDDEDIVDLGKSICTALDSGSSLLVVIGNGLDAGFTPEESGFITGASIGAFCPEYEDLVDNF